MADSFYDQLEKEAAEFEGKNAPKVPGAPPDGNSFYDQLEKEAEQYLSRERPAAKPEEPGVLETLGKTFVGSALSTTGLKAEGMGRLTGTEAPRRIGEALNEKAKAFAVPEAESVWTPRGIAGSLGSVAGSAVGGMAAGVGGAIAGGAVTGGNPVGAFLGGVAGTAADVIPMSVGEISKNYKEKTGKDLSMSEIAPYAAAHAGTEIFTDVVTLRAARLIPGFKGMAGKLGGKIYDSWWKTVGKAGAASGVFEPIEEGLQSLITAAPVARDTKQDLLSGENVNEAVKNYVYALPGSVLFGAITGGVGAGHARMQLNQLSDKDTKESKRAQIAEEVSDGLRKGGREDLAYVWDTVAAKHIADKTAIPTLNEDEITKIAKTELDKRVGNVSAWSGQKEPTGVPQPTTLTPDSSTPTKRAGEPGRIVSEQPEAPKPADNTPVSWEDFVAEANEIQKLFASQQPEVPVAVPPTTPVEAPVAVPAAPETPVAPVNNVQGTVPTTQPAPQTPAPEPTPSPAPAPAPEPENKVEVPPTEVPLSARPENKELLRDIISGLKSPTIGLNALQAKKWGAQLVDEGVTDFDSAIRKFIQERGKSISQVNEKPATAPKAEPSVTPTETVATEPVVSQTETTVPNGTQAAPMEGNVGEQGQTEGLPAQSGNRWNAPPETQRAVNQLKAILRGEPEFRGNGSRIRRVDGIVPAQPKASRIVEQKTATLIASMLGKEKKVHYVDSRGLFSGVKTNGSKDVFIDVNTKDPYAAVFAHEFGHLGNKDEDAKLQNVLRRVVTPEKFQEFKAKWTSERENIRQENDNQMWRELQSEFVASELTNPRFWEEMHRESKGLFRRMVDWTIRALKALGVDNVSTNALEYYTHPERVAEAQKAIRDWVAATAESNENTKRAEVSFKAEAKQETKQSVAESALDGVKEAIAAGNVKGELNITVKDNGKTLTVSTAKPEKVVTEKQPAKPEPKPTPKTESMAPKSDLSEIQKAVTTTPDEYTFKAKNGNDYKFIRHTYGKNGNLGFNVVIRSMDGKSVGALMASPSQGGKAFKVDQYEVFGKEQRRQGLGTELLRNANRYARSVGRVLNSGVVASHENDRLWKRAVDEGRATPVKGTFGQEYEAKANFMPPRKSDLGFYSKLEQRIEDAKQDKFTTQQLLGFIDPRKGSGIKQEEITDSGIEKWLGGKKFVTKGEVLDFLRERPQLREALMGPTGKVSIIKDDFDKQYPYIVTISGQRYMSFPDMESAREAVRDIESTGGRYNPSLDNRPKFSSWMHKSGPPAGKDYREALMTVGQKETVADRIAQIKSELKKETDILSPQYTKLLGELEKLESQEVKDTYYPPDAHQYGDEAADRNRLTHRMYEKQTASDGTDMLLMREGQSDVHKAGREEGYATPISAADRKAATSAAEEAIRNNDNLGFESLHEAKVAILNHDDWDTRWDVNKDQVETINAWRKLLPEDKGVPDLPHKKSWALLNIKRMIDDAVKQGITRVGWSTGGEVAERYSLRQAVQEIHSNPHNKTTDSGPDITIILNNRDKKIMLGTTRNGIVEDASSGDEFLIGKPLEQIVGRENAQRLMASPTMLKGTGVAIGGEWANALYDRQLVNEVNDYLKQWGVKVKKDSVETKVPAKEYYAEGTTVYWAATQRKVQDFNTPEAARDFVNKHNTNEISTQHPVWSFDIPPEMAESVRTVGQPEYMPALKEEARQIAIGAKDNIVAAKDEIKKLFNPANMADPAQMLGGIKTMAGIIRAWNSERSTHNFVAGKMLLGVKKWWQLRGEFDRTLSHLTEKQNEVMYDFFEREKRENRPIDSFPDLAALSQKDKDNLVRLSQTRREIIEPLWNVIREQKGIETFIQDYFTHFWKDSEKKNAYFRDVLSKTPAAGSESFTHKRIFQYIKDGLDAGLEMETTDPIDNITRITSLLTKSIMWHEVMHEGVGSGLLVASDANKFGKDLPTMTDAKGNPTGWVKINDPSGRIQSITKQGVLTRKEYYAPEPIARIINNYLSPGLVGKSKLYDAARWTGNMMNSIQLGLSAFHFMFTAPDAVAGGSALGLQEMLRGDIQKGLARLTKSVAIAPFEVGRMWRRGAAFEKEMIAGNFTNPRLAQAFVSSGGRVAMDAFYRLGAINKLNENLRTGNKIRAAAIAPFAVIEAVAVPVMEVWVPRLKVGMFMDMMQSEFEYWDKHNPGQTMPEETVREKGGEIWNSVENRLGQLTYDNLFWNKTLKDLSMASVRSVGWNGGSIREFSGAASDLRKIKIGPSGIEVSPRLAYAMAMPFIIGLLGALIHKVGTGEPPDELKDYFYPRTGRNRPDGEPERLSIPSYMKDIYPFIYYATHLQFGKIGLMVSHKSSPLISAVSDMLRNSDYYGTEIRDRHDGMVKQVEDGAKYLLEQMKPFSVRGAETATQTTRPGKETFAAAGMAFLGLNPAPKYVTMSKSDEMMNDYYTSKRDTEIPRDTMEDRKAKGKATQLLRMGRVAEAQALRKEQGWTNKEWQRQVKKSKTDARLNSFKAIGDVETAVRVYQVADPAERQLFRRTLLNKINNSTVLNAKEKQEFRREMLKTK